MKVLLKRGFIFGVGAGVGLFVTLLVLNTFVGGLLLLLRLL